MEGGSVRLSEIEKLCEIEKHSQLGPNFSENTMSSFLFADDFVGITETGATLQSLVNIV